ncbi:DYW domain [Dillenia turbinata]|uniref:DYW domain n=1 Tax=Dillenia turbinata TaxID=194707 RepID=A0AAN8V120_9MAGN
MLQQCKTTGDVNEIHAHVIKTRLHLNPIIAGNLLESAAILLPKSTDYAVSIFDQIDEPNAAAYNVTIRGFILKHSPHEAIRLLQAVKEGERIHAQIVKLGFRSNGFVVNSLIYLYASFGKIEVRHNVFDGLSDKGIVSWNSMFSVCTKSGQLGVNSDGATLLGVLMACGGLADIGLDELICEYIEGKGLMGYKALVTYLVDVYAKCGHVDVWRFFNQMAEKNVVAWSAMISGYSQLGNCREALDLFHEMQKANVDHNEITMISVLSSCADPRALGTGIGPLLHEVKKVEADSLIQGLANNGQEKNARDFGIESRLEHYGWMADILGRAVGRCTGLRSQMIEKRIKSPGCTLIELDGEIDEILAEENKHPYALGIYDATESIMKRIKVAGFAINTVEVRLEAEQDDKGASVSRQSEKLAIALGLIRTSPGTTTRKSKTLRVCIDCHNATKFISKTFDREIVESLPSF